MKKILFLIVVALIGYRCNHHSEPSAVDNYSNKKAELKAQLTEYDQLLASYRDDSVSLLNLNDGYYPKFKSEIVSRGNDEKLKSVFPEIEYAILKGVEINTSIHFTESQERVFSIIESSLLQTSNDIEKYGLRTASDSISIDSVYAYFDNFKIVLENDLEIEEGYIDTNENLTESEKLALVASSIVARQSIDHLC